MKQWIETNRTWLFTAVVVGVAAMLAWPAISQPGLLNTRGGGDSPFLLQRLHQLEVALRDGHFPVRWMPDANYGYGYPFYNFYAPLSIYITAAMRFLGFSTVRAIHLSQLLGFIVAGLGMFELARRWLGGRWVGLLAAVAYSVAPFHMVNVYVRGDSLAEFWAMAFYPLILLAADGLLEAPTNGIRRRVTLFALSYAALILSHNISALIFTPFLLLYIMLRILQRNRAGRPAAENDQGRARFNWRPLLGVTVGLVLAMALAAWFFVPALAEQDLAQLSPVTEGYFHYSNHFRGLDIAQTGVIFDYSPDGGRAFRMGLLQAGLALAGGIVLILFTRQGRSKSADPDRVLYIWLVAIISTLMITPLSRPLWDLLPLLSFTQFPWRFLSVQALAVALMIGGLAWLPYRQLVVGLAALVMLLSGLLGLPTDYLTITDADVTTERLAQYEWFTGNIGSTVSAEYLPPYVNPRPFSSAWLNNGERNRVNVMNGHLERAELLSRRTDEQKWLLEARDSGATVMLPTLYWPGWQAEIDGQVTDLQAQHGSGLMMLVIPPGKHEIQLRLTRTPVRLAAEWVSLAAIIVAAVLLVVGGRGTSWRRPLFLSLAGLGLLVLSAFILRRTDPPPLPVDDLNWDFAQMGYLHHDPAGVDFDNGATLFSYGYSHGTIQAGDTLTITVSMRPKPGSLAILDLTTPALARPVPEGLARPPVITSQSIVLDQETLVFTLPIPDNAPEGLVIPRLRLSDGRPLMASGQTRGELFLRPLTISQGAVTALANPVDEASDGVFDVEMTTSDLNLRDPNTLDGQFQWLIDEPAGQHYQVSWRLQDANGGIISQLDTQPGYGFQPTVGWPVDVPVNDWLALNLPPTLTNTEPYALVMVLYDPASGEEIMMRRLGQIEVTGGKVSVQPHLPDVTPLPQLDEDKMDIFFEDNRPLIHLLGYDLHPENQILRVTLHWQAVTETSTNYTRFVHLLDHEDNIVGQVDSHPFGNSLPTEQWTAGENISDTVEFQLPEDFGRDIKLAVGFYDPATGMRLLPHQAGVLNEDGRLLLPVP